MLTGGLAALVWGIKQAQPGNGADPEQGTAAMTEAMGAPRENAVLVFGSTGKLGRQIVAQVSIDMPLQATHMHFFQQVLYGSLCIG